MDCCENNECRCGSNGCTEGQKTINIDFLYLDLDTCTRCKGTYEILEEAITEVINVLNLAGVKVTLNKIYIDSMEKAIQYEFLSSPTIRVDGNDIQTDVKETQCECCGDICGDQVDCRVWMYQGKEYTVPPKAMIINAILKAVYGSSKKINNKEYKMPKNIKKFFESLEKN